MAVILDLRVGSSTEDQLKYLKEQLERILTEMEDKTGGVQSIETVLNDDNTMSLIITDMTGNKTETEIQNAAGVESIVTQYYLSTSKTTQTGGEWVTTQPEWEPAHYFWQRNLITWTDGDVAGTSPRLMSAINEACEKAYAALQPEDVTVSQNPTQTGYEVTIGEETFSLLNGTDGADGADGAPGSPGADGFSPVATVTKSGDTATITITDKNGVTSESVSDGADGADGSDGISVTSIQSQYYLSTSPSGATGGSWSNSLTYEAGKYMWTRDQITYSNNTVDYSTAIYNQALTSACSSAHEAETAATTANTAATGALTGLSTVQDVIGMLNWAAENATYSLTQDTDIMPGKTYWTRSGAGTAADPYVYTPVVNPVKTALSTYYEITGVDEAMGDFINAHLALTEEGLWILPDGMDTASYRVLVATGGQGHTYEDAGTYIIDSTGKTVAKLGEVITLGSDNGEESHLTMDYHSLQLIDKEGDKYLFISDLRDKNGCLKDDFTGNGTNKSFDTLVSVAEIEKVTIDSEIVSPSEYTISAYNRGIYFNNAPPYKSAIEVIYLPTDTKKQQAKAYTLGTRDSFYRVGDLSFAFGEEVAATSHADYAEGYKTRARGGVSHAEGGQTDATGMYAHAEGISSEAHGHSAHAEGLKSVASGNYSHAQNRETIAAKGSQTAIGKFNAEDTETTESKQKALIIGNGTSNSNRSNAFTVDWQGNVDIASGAKYKINGTDLSASDVGAVPTTRKVNNKALSSDITLNASDVSALPISGGTITGDLTVNGDTTLEGVTYLGLDTTAASGTTDGDLYAAIVALGWQNDVIE